MVRPSAASLFASPGACSGAPKFVGVDNEPGVRLEGARSLGLRERRHARLQPAGQADRQRVRRELQRPPARRVPEHPLVPVAGPTRTGSRSTSRGPASRPSMPTSSHSMAGFRDECLNVHWFLSLADARAKIEAWRRHYNESRPHTWLGWMTPSEHAAAVAQKASERRRTLTLKLEETPGSPQRPASSLTKPEPSSRPSSAPASVSAETAPSCAQRREGTPDSPGHWRTERHAAQREILRETCDFGSRPSLWACRQRCSRAHFPRSLPMALSSTSGSLNVLEAMLSEFLCFAPAGRMRTLFAGQVASDRNSGAHPTQEARPGHRSDTGGLCRSVSSR